MSHLVTLKARFQDVAAVEAACRRLNLPAPVKGTARIYSTEATGLIVQFPGWTFPAVIDVTSGTVAYDNFNGNWGADVEIQKFMQMYAVEAAKIEARRKGHTCSEQLLADGSIKLAIEVS
ncbi:MAG: DUF1257 domain-containing protein [Gemmataceae bacterium]